jgi:thioredoxin reductase (NADPH)
MTTRQLQGDGFAELTGRGIYYGASLTEASAYRDQDIVIVGAANSAGQGALFFARFARSVTMLVRGDGLERSMSDYLVRQIRNTPNIEVLLHTSMVAAQGGDRLKTVTIQNSSDGTSRDLETAAAFVFIGTIPHGDVVADVVARDEHGFILTGADLMSDGKRPRGWTGTIAGSSPPCIPAPMIPV